MKLQQPVIKMIGKNQAILNDNYSIKIRVGSKSYSLKIYNGFTFDGASIPRTLWPIFGSPWDADHLPAALVHDALYASESTTREQADKIFHELLKRNGISAFAAYSMYLAVRCFGWRLWPHRASSREKARTLVKLSSL